ncbi:MAG: hypothetical protein BWY04_00750 [candidate division CPR1 bacterium ADurb.Bin160]|uniref:ATPase dynein-related AAA domain-containing protein n=1 Tax=candidate division CPR1 bacterium ADurb.Bin160 TaxID=1852826 RepID=A0A1V5ZMQ7_9BACT|nr:MAG: hypothetical protein BWY04_00750 [candidate division CPR1 bacterium ADurb.Bin160]
MAENFTYQERLNAPIVSISNAKEIIKQNIKNTVTAWREGVDIEKQTFRLIGEAGVGKTQICYQIAKEMEKELNIPFSVIRVTASVLSRDDFIIPFPVQNKENESEEYSFKMLYSDFVPKDKDSYGIFVIDEASRGRQDLQQVLWQIQNEQAIHQHKFPKGWFIIALDNPDEPIYEMETMQDPAGIRRVLHMCIEISPLDFLNHAIKEKFHDTIIEFIQTHPDHLYDFEAQKMGAIFANPASYERLSNILKGFEMNGGITENLKQIEYLASGLLNVSMARIFIDFLKNIRIIKPEEIFRQYPMVRKEILGYIENSNNPKLVGTLNSFTTYLLTSLPPFTKKELDNIGSFLDDLPPDIGIVFMLFMKKSEVTKDAEEYMTNLHLSAIKTSKSYKSWYEKIRNIPTVAQN